jgi:CRP-like cAMP-binding protein
MHPSNLLLAAMTPEDRDWLLARSVSVEMKGQHKLEIPGRQIAKVYFIETGIASVLTVSGTEEIGLGLIGCEGASGIAVLLGATTSPHSTIMLNDGSANAISADDLRLAMERSAQLRVLLLRYVLAFENQVAHTALSNALSTVEERVARWVLMTHDRVARDDIPLTHEVIARILGVRRAGVSSALEKLRAAELIAIERGNVRVLDLEGLGSKAGRFYGLPERQFEKLIGSQWPPICAHQPSDHNRSLQAALDR